MKKNKVAIITGGGLPVPNVRGGAVESLLTLLGKENEKKKLIDLTFFSSMDEEAVNVSAEANQSKGSTTHYIFFSVPRIIQTLDLYIYFFAKNVMHKHDLMSYRYFLQRMWYNHKVAQYCATFDFDYLVFENTMFPMRMLKKSKCKKYVSRSFLHMHNDINHTFGMADIIPEIAGIITVSNFISQKICKQFPNLDQAKVHVLYNCIDTERFNPNNTEIIQKGRMFREKLGIPSQATVFLFSGRLTEEKGAKQLLQAFGKLEYADAYLVIVGAYFFDSQMNSPFGHVLHSLADKTHGRVKFTGYIDYADMPVVYSIADICVLPSIWDEPAGLTIIESIVSGTPLITTYSGGIPEYVNGKTAIILERNDDLVNELAKNMRLIAESTEVRKKMSREALKLGKQYNAKSYLANFVKCIK